MLVTNIGHTQDKIVEASVVPILIIKDQLSHDWCPSYSIVYNLGWRTSGCSWLVYRHMGRELLPCFATSEANHSSTPLVKLTKKNYQQKFLMLKLLEPNKSLSTKNSNNYLYNLNYDSSLPIGSMYAIYGNIYHQYTPNVSITIHGSYGLWFPMVLPKNISGFDDLAGVALAPLKAWGDP